MKRTEYIVPIDGESRNIDEIFTGEIRKQSVLIRCKDCKYRNEYSYCTFYINWHHLTGEMDYCSDAERKEEE